MQRQMLCDVCHHGVAIARTVISNQGELLSNLQLLEFIQPYMESSLPEPVDGKVLIQELSKGASFTWWTKKLQQRTKHATTTPTYSLPFPQTMAPTHSLTTPKKMTTTAHSFPNCHIVHRLKVVARHCCQTTVACIRGGRGSANTVQSICRRRGRPNRSNL